MRMNRRVSVGLAAWLVTGCYSGVHSTPQGEEPPGQQPEGEDAGDDDGTELPTPEELEALGMSGLRRLSAAEYDATLRDLLGADLVDAELLLPVDPRAPYDNEYTLQISSQALVEGVDLLASDAAEAVIADPARRNAVVGCAPTGPDDVACLRRFVTSFGRLALRRSLSDEEVERFTAFIDHAIEAQDFDMAVQSVLRALLQHPELIYRVEIGEPVEDEPGVFRLRPPEVATRLSYLLWGSTPDAWLLDMAEDGGLETDDDVRAAAASMLEDPRARGRVVRFHAMWMGYEQLPFGPTLADPMRGETTALVERVIFEEQRPWQDLLRFDQTLVDATLAEHYGLDWPGGSEPTWVDYGGSGRQGLLSHGSFLSVGGKFDDTSPTLRGLAIRSRLMCQDVPPPPPDVDVDEPPQGVDENACKEERYSVHAAGGCKGCHDLMDPVGFGLESYDAAGRYRAHDLDRPDCPISGVGTLDGETFEGPAGLSDMLLASPSLGRCVATQVYRFAMGRYELYDEDEDFITMLGERAGTNQDFAFDTLLLEFVSSPTFRYRREEEA